MEGHIPVKKRDNRKSLCRLQRKAWIKVYENKRTKEKSTGIVDYFWLP